MTSPTPLWPTRVPGLEGGLLKVEGANLTGSFKDRVMRTLVNEALQDGRPGAVVASSGNAAIAAAAACARANLPLLVLVPQSVSPSAVRMVELRGAAVLRVGDGPAAVHGFAVKLAERHGLADLASTFRAASCEWACRGIGDEIARQATDVVTHLVASISVGPVLIGAGNGMVDAGRPGPALVGAQSTGCAPIARAWASGAAVVMPWTDPVDTRCTAIADRLTGYAGEASFALQRIRNSGGFVGAVTDDEMRAMRIDLARYDGLDVELASCAAPALWRSTGSSAQGVVCILTGAGTKETLSADGDLGPPPSIAEYAARSGIGRGLLEEIDRWISASRS